MSVLVVTEQQGGRGRLIELHWLTGRVSQTAY